jgi:hypothetical protein
MTTADGKTAADAVAKLMGLLVQAPAAVAPSPPQPTATAAPPPPPVVTDFTWATTQLQAGKSIRRISWGGTKYVFIRNAQSWMQLPDGFPTFGARVPWLWDPTDTAATDWEIAT